MYSERERKLRERSRVLKEQRTAIERLARQASNQIEEKYKRMYGENWKQALSNEQVAVIERMMMEEKLTSSTMAEQHMLLLKSNR